MTRASDNRVSWLARNILPHEPALRRWLGRRVRFGGLGLGCDDIVQEAYAKLAAMERVDHILNPRAYLFQTANSILLQEIRRLRVVPIEAMESSEMLQIASAAPSVDREVEGRQELRMVVAMIDLLPAKCREVFLLRKVHGLSQREIASRLNITENTVEKHIALGVRKLMDTYRNGGIQPVAASTAVELGESSNAKPRDKRRN